MEVKKAIKKVVALAAGASMVGATILGASAAADLANYPAPFIQDGVFNGVLVVGDQAKAEDVIGITDIATSLQFAAKTTTTTTTDSSSSGTVTSVEGDAWLVGSAGNKLELQDASVAETFDSATTRVSETELAALADGTTQTSKGTAPYEQYVRLEDGSVQFQEDTDTDIVADYVRYSNGNAVMNYSMEFTTSWESDIEDSASNSDTTGLFLTDYEDEDITVGQSTYTVLKARRYSTSNYNGIKLTLLGGDVTDSLEEGETKTYTIGSKEYTVENVIVTDSGTTYTQFRINGELTKKMQEDQTVSLSDGSIFGVADILANEAGDLTGDIVRFYLGAQKLEIEDADITNSASNSMKVTVNDESVSSSVVDAWIKGTNPSNTSFKIDKINIDIKADDNVWVPAGKKLTDNSQLDEDAVALLKVLGLDIYYAGLTDEGSETIQLQTSGDDKYTIKFKNVRGDEITVPFAYDNTSSTEVPATTTAIWGDQSNRLTLTPQTRVAKDQYFILSSDSSANFDESTVSEIVQYKGADRLWDSAGNLESSPELKLKYLGSGETSTRSITSSGGNAQATFTFGGQEYTVQNATSAHTNDWDMRITAGTYNQTAVVTQNGAVIAFRNNGTADWVGGFTVLLVKVANQMDSSTQPDVIDYTIQATAADQKVGATRSSGLNPVTVDYDNNVKEEMNAYGTHLKDTKDSTNPRVLDITVPKTQRLAQVYLTGGKVKASTSTTTTATATEIVKIDVGAAQLASAVAGREKQENLLLVGGPCANLAVRAITGATEENCAEGYTAGKAKIQLFEHEGGKVALLVAGYSAADTRAAAKVIANYDKHADVFKGTNLEVSDTASASPTVGPATVAAAPAATTDTGTA